MPSEKRIDPREQFSKKFATWTARFWFLYMLVVAAMCLIQPEVADAAVYLAICTSIIALVNVWAYTHNSVYEKALLAMMQNEKMKLSWKGTHKDEPDSEEDEGGDG